MNWIENVKEGLRSIQANMLRTVLTALIIAIGITSLVGILTAIDGIQSSVDNSFAALGANSFDIRNPQIFRRRSGGMMERKFPPIEFREAVAYKNQFGKNATVSISTSVSGIAQIKFESKKTNPNVLIKGGDENYLAIKGYKIAQGRNFSNNDLELATNVAILGQEVITSLFESNQNPIGKEISILGQRFQVIGILDKKGSMGGGGDDRIIVIPLETGRRMAANRTLSFDITTSSPQITDLDMTMGEARGTFRLIRGDALGNPDSFDMERSDSFAKNFEDITGYLRVGGFGIGFITLLGAAIALMNIMMVSVTERTREIGIRKSLGATPSRIREQFLIEAIVICVIGGFGGLVLGIAVGNLISSVISSSSSFIVPWLWMSVGIAISIVVGILSGYYPAFKASKLDPIESLRYE
ncbi:MAG: ABC transporter permease [Spirosomataceae bacterium]